MLDVDWVLLRDVFRPPQLIGRAVSADIDGIQDAYSCTEVKLLGAL
jgi:hypothetical protein